MCALCGMGIPVCNLAGSCSIQTLDFIKIVSITGGAGLGVAVTTVRDNINKKKLVKNKDENPKKS